MRPSRSHVLPAFPLLLAASEGTCGGGPVPGTIRGRAFTRECIPASGTSPVSATG